MRGHGVLALVALVGACGGALTVPADACRGGAVPSLVGRNVGEVAVPPGLPHRVVIPGAAEASHPPGTLLLGVDDKGWITAVGCAR